MQPFQVDANEVAPLNEHELVRLVNRLIWHEGRRLRLPFEAVRITLRIHDPDGGAAITRGCGCCNGIDEKSCDAGLPVRRPSNRPGTGGGGNTVTTTTPQVGACE